MERGIRNQFNSGSTTSGEFDCFFFGSSEMEGKCRHRYFSTVCIRVTSAQIQLN